MARLVYFCSGELSSEVVNTSSSESRPHRVDQGNECHPPDG